MDNLKDGFSMTGPCSRPEGWGGANQGDRERYSGNDTGKGMINLDKVVNRKLTNSEYRDETGVSKATATKDLFELVNRGLLRRKGIPCKVTIYELQKGSERDQRALKGLSKGLKIQDPNETQRDQTGVTMRE